MRGSTTVLVMPPVLRMAVMKHFLLALAEKQDMEGFKGLVCQHGLEKHGCI